MRPAPVDDTGVEGLMPMNDLKPISQEAIPLALERGMRYRLLNDPWQAESICRDVLRAVPDHQEALRMLVMCMTDQFGQPGERGMNEVLEMVTHLTEPYQRDYCTGIVHERHAVAVLRKGYPQSREIAHVLLEKAMGFYAKAEPARPENNEDPILRWNACVRIIRRHKLVPSPQEEGPISMLE
jgi:hypothetical protein